MKIAVVAANGRVGRLVVKEAVERGIDVTAFVRSDNKTAATQVIQKDIMDLVPEDLAGFDAVVDAFGTWNEADFPKQTITSQHLCDVLSGTDTRLLIVGGAGSLYVNPEHTVQVYQTEGFPPEFVSMAKSQVDELDALRKRDDVKWTFVSPAGDFQAEGPRTGAYILGGDELTLSEDGKSEISYADYAIAMVDEVEKGDHIQQRISVVRK
ncbi:MAG: NAD(P)H-binding protein [Olegusella sp.]|nr:NAD(P)H-binding protein [Olegusella sp.]